MCLLPLLNCVPKREEVVIRGYDFCEVYQEPETNKLSVAAKDYWFELEKSIKAKKDQKKQLDSQEELFYALIKTVGKYEEKYEKLCKEIK